MILLIILFNWFILFVTLGLFTSSSTEALLGSILAVLGLLGIAYTPFTENLFKWSSGLRPASIKERSKVEELIYDLSQKAHLRKTPEIYVADHSFPNAYAMGKHTIGITTGLLETATREELYGVLAHEIGHLKLGHSIRCVIAKVFNAGGLFAAWVIFHTIRFQSYSVLPSPTGMINETFAVSLAVMYLLIGVLRWYFGLGPRVVGPKEEYHADSFVVQAGGGSGFISFLRTTASPQTVGTHPPALHRIERMKKRMTV